MTAGATYTASQLARALGITRQAVTKALPPTPASVWPFDALSLDWQEQITRRAGQRGFENGETFLASLPDEPWKSPVPWERIASKEQIKAARLQKALARALELRSDPDAPAGASETAGLEDYKKEFGYAVDPRHLRRLIARTIHRDGGEENWQHLALYLDNRAFALPKANPAHVRAEFQHRELDAVFAGCTDRQNPTAEDREYLWIALLQHYEQHAGETSERPTTDLERKQFKASLLAYVFKAFPAGTLCGSFKSLKNRFDEKLSAWREQGMQPEALRDRRALESGNFRRVKLPEDAKKIRNLAIKLDGNETLAHRMLRERGQLSEEFCAAVPYDPRHNKSALPRALREEITPQVDACLALRRGPWQARMSGPYIPRDWSAEMPGDWFCADDVTWNHYYREQLPDGRWTVMRGECLMMIDVRTDYPLEFSLISGHYNGEHVRSLILRTHNLYGLPRKGFYFENGVWSSRLVTGGRRHGETVHWRETESGLAKLDLNFRHAYTPRAKPIEGVFGLLQERMRCIPGFVGFDERRYDAERVQPLIARAQRGDEATLHQFPTAREWADKIRAVVQEFRHDPQNGKKLSGKSPSEAWREGIQCRGLKKLSDETLYLLATDARVVTPKEEGIALKIRGKPYLYYNGHTGKAFVDGGPRLAFFNIEMPELLVVSDMNRQNYFSVKAVELPAMSATPAQLAEVNKLRRAHMSAARTIFGECEREAASFITRDNEHPEADKALGRFHNEEVKKAISEKAETGRKVTRARKKLIAAGYDPDRMRLKNPDAVAEATERLAATREALLKKEREMEANPNE